MNRKPLNHKSYGHIAHLPGSRMGPSDHKCHEGQIKIACEETRDKHDRVIVQEKLDGSNVGVCLVNNTILPITRAGYLANTSPFKMHHAFNDWVYENEARFRAVLSEGERICGEWLLVAHGTLYNLPHEPFVAFDLMVKKHNRVPFDKFSLLAEKGDFIIPYVIHDGGPLSVETALTQLGKYGHHGALEEVEGAVWRVERNEMIDKHRGNIGGRSPIVDFLVKYVRPDKEDGKYLIKDGIGEIIYNTIDNQALNQSWRKMPRQPG